MKRLEVTVFIIFIFNVTFCRPSDGEENDSTTAMAPVVPVEAAKQFLSDPANRRSLQKVPQNTFFEARGLLPDIFGGKRFRITLDRYGPDSQGYNRYELRQLRSSILTNSARFRSFYLSSDHPKASMIAVALDGEKIFSPWKLPLMLKSLPFSKVLGFAGTADGFWVPDSKALTSRVGVLNTYLPEELKLLINFYGADEKVSAEEFVDRFAKSASLPMVDVDTHPLAMHDWGHMPVILTPKYLVEIYQVYANDAILYVEFLKQHLSVPKYQSLSAIVYAGVGKQIDRELTNFMNAEVENVLHGKDPPNMGGNFTVSTAPTSFYLKIKKAFREASDGERLLNETMLHQFLKETPQVKNRKYQAPKGFLQLTATHIEALDEFIKSDSKLRKEFGLRPN